MQNCIDLNEKKPKAMDIEKSIIVGMQLVLSLPFFPSILLRSVHVCASSP